MDEVRIVRHRTHVWPVIIAIILLAIVIGYVFFARRGPASQVGRNVPAAEHHLVLSRASFDPS